MPCYELNVQLNRGTDREPVVRVWVDPDPDADLGSEVELPLRRRAMLEWTAIFIAPRGPFLYRIGLVAEPGSVWEVSIRQRGPRQREVLFDSDLMVSSKQWLLGTCDL